MNRLHEIGPLLRKQHGMPVRKLCLTVGATCPNRDGSLGTGGCIYCLDAETTQGLPLEAQIQRGLSSFDTDTALIAYLQDHTATYIPPARLDRILSRLGGLPPIVSITIGTRPDCVEAPILAVLERHASRGVDLLVELGLQSANPATLELIGRGHDLACFRRAVDALHALQIRVCAHVILGLPTPAPTTPAGLVAEGVAHAAATAELLAGVAIDAVKVHNCHVLRGTALARLFDLGRYTPPSLAQYIELLIAFIERLPAEVEVHRLMGEARSPELIAPAFTGQKNRALQQIRRAFEERNTWQGRLAGAPPPG